jgi:DeoD family purine-nucleoside phosphorylase
VLLPGDPGRALALAQSLLSEPRMFNHNRGLWGYTGEAADGALLTIQSTGMGGPSAAIVISELADLGAQRLIRVGTCGALHGSLGLGDLVVAPESIADDGTSRALGAGDRVSADPGLAAALAAAASDGDVAVGTVVSTDLFYDGPPGCEQRWLAAGAVAVEMEAATLFALAARRGLRAGTVLAVSDIVLPRRRRIEPEALAVAERAMGELAVRALG